MDLSDLIALAGSEAAYGRRPPRTSCKLVKKRFQTSETFSRELELQKIYAPR